MSLDVAQTQETRSQLFQRRKFIVRLVFGMLLYIGVVLTFIGCISFFASKYSIAHHVEKGTYRRNHEPESTLYVEPQSEEAAAVVERVHNSQITLLGKARGFRWWFERSPPSTRHESKKWSRRDLNEDLQAMEDSLVLAEQSLVFTTVIALTFVGILFGMHLGRRHRRGTRKNILLQLKEK